MILITFPNIKEPVSLEISSFYLLRLRKVLHGIANLIYRRERPPTKDCQEFVQNTLMELGLFSFLVGADTNLLRALYDEIKLAESTVPYKRKVFEDIFQKNQSFEIEVDEKKTKISYAPPKSLSSLVRDEKVKERVKK